MKLYIITISDVYDFESFFIKPLAFLSEKEAQKELKRLYKSAKETYKDEYDSEDIVKGKSFSLYPDGSHGTSHYDAAISEVEVEGGPFLLNAIFGESASRKAGEIGAKRTARLIANGKIDGSCETVAFDTEEDCRKAAELLDSADGWLGTYWEITKTKQQ